MKRSLAVLLVLSGVGTVLRCEAQITAGLGEKADVFVEVQQIPLESFGVPAEIANPKGWSAWIVRLTNRRKYPIMVQACPQIPPRTPLDALAPQDHAARDEHETKQTGLGFSYSNWRLCDGEGKIVGKVTYDVLVPDEKSGSAVMANVFSYLLDQPSPLGDMQFALRAPPRRTRYEEARWLEVLFQSGAREADIVARKYTRPRLRSPVIYKPELASLPTPALWPNKSTWGHLIFYRSIATRSQRVVPRGDFGKGVSWYCVINPKLLDELTVPQEETQEPPPAEEDPIQRWLREHGYKDEEDDK